jgi:hypothetical protein
MEARLARRSDLLAARGVDALELAAYAGQNEG